MSVEEVNLLTLGDLQIVVSEESGELRRVLVQSIPKVIIFYLG
jgi:hypothetical protein